MVSGFGFQSMLDCSLEHDLMLKVCSLANAFLFPTDVSIFLVHAISIKHICCTYTHLLTVQPNFVYPMSGKLKRYKVNKQANLTCRLHIFTKYSCAMEPIFTKRPIDIWSCLMKLSLKHI